MTLDQQPKVVKCPICESMMRYNARNDFWKCYTCWHELWPTLKKKEDEEKQFRERRLVHSRYGGEINPPLPIINPCKRSSSSSKRRKKKKPLKPWYQRGGGL
jgi:hypothetical protein